MLAPSTIAAAANHLNADAAPILNKEKRERKGKRGRRAGDGGKGKEGEGE